MKNQKITELVNQIMDEKNKESVKRDLFLRGLLVGDISGPLTGFPSQDKPKSVIEADRILANLNKEAARLIRKVLVSATANAENNLGLDKNNLYVKEAYINEGQTMKRARMGSRGHVDPSKKRTSHITVVVSEKN